MSTPTLNDLWFLPLGGCGEIGMNMNLYGHNDAWLMVDCGLTFSKEDGPERVVCADPSFISERRDKLIGLVITHAHEDHVGAVPYIWPQLKCPIYASPFTAEILRRKLAEHNLLDDVPLTVIPPGGRHSVGPYDLEWVKLTHSILEPQGLVISTSAGTVFHTADWKLDKDPVIGFGYAEARYKAMAQQNITAMVCDSTNATLPGWSTSESELYPGLLECVKAATGRVVVSCFGSNLARILTLSQVSQACDRYIGMLGRSLHNMVRAARLTDHWPEEHIFVSPGHLGYLPPQEVLAIATGSQGEPLTALNRLAAGSHPDLDLDEGDTVIFSSRTIPGNEEQVDRLKSQLRERKITVIDDSYPTPIHASGHPHQDELKQLYRWVQPKIAIPVHGEARHMAANAKVAKETMVPRQLTGENGDLFQIAPSPRLRRKFTRVGRIIVRQD